MEKQSDIKKARKVQRNDSSSIILLGKWLNWAVTNGHVYNDEGLSVETANLLFGSKKRIANLKKLLHDTAG